MLLPGMLQIIPLGSSQGSPGVQSQVPDPAPGPSNAEQSLMARGLSSVYDPTQEAEEQAAKAPEVGSRAVIALSATPAEALDNRSVPDGHVCQSASSAQCKLALDRHMVLTRNTCVHNWTVAQLYFRQSCPVYHDSADGAASICSAPLAVTIVC